MNSAPKLPEIIFKKVSRLGSLTRVEVRDRYRIKTRKANDVFSLSAAFARTKLGENWEEKIASAKIRNHWPEIIGSLLAQSIEIISLEEGEVKVSTSNPTFATQLKIQKRVILSKINDFVGFEIARDISVLNTGAPPQKSRKFFTGSRRAKPGGRI